MEHIMLKTTAMQALDSAHNHMMVGCGGIPDGFHGSVNANGTLSHGSSNLHAGVGTSYGSEHFSASGNIGTTQVHQGGFSASNNTAHGQAYVCPSGNHGNTYSVGFNGSHSNNFGFNGPQSNSGSISFGSSW